MKKNLKRILWALPVIFLLLQLTNPARKNPAARNDMITANQPPADVATSIRGACYDCHSNETQWPWYAHVAPGSWFVASDVSGGRAHVNFSDWPTNPVVAVRKWGWIYEIIAHDEMPPSQYSLLHPAARISKNDKQALLNWIDSEARKQMTLATNN